MANFFFTACDVASFIGFLNFYSVHISCLEQRIVSLLILTKLDTETVITDLLTAEYEAAKMNMINSIFSVPCIACFYHKKCPYLLTDFSETFLVMIYVNPIVMALLLWQQCTGK